MLPAPTSQRTILAYLKFNIYLYYEGTGISIVHGNPPIPTENNAVLKKSLVNRYHRIPSWQNPILIALEYKNLLRSDGFETQTQLADHLQASKARITQYLNLLKLDSSIISYISSMKNSPKYCYITERTLRQLTQIKSPSLQRKKFFKMINHPSN